MATITKQVEFDSDNDVFLVAVKPNGEAQHVNLNRSKKVNFDALARGFHSIYRMFAVQVNQKQRAAQWENEDD